MTIASTKDALIAARDLISDPKRWTQGVLARDSNGNNDSVYGETACSFCASGALLRVSRGFFTEAIRALMVADGQDPNDLEAPTVPIFNDTHTHAEVLALFDRAIEAQ